MKLSDDEQAELRALISAPSTPAATATRATIVLLRGRGVTRGPIAMQCSVSLPTVDRWVHRYAEHGIAGLSEQPRCRIQIPDRVRSRILELAASPPPADTRLTRWTRRTLADHLQRTQDITVSDNYVATVLREAGVRLIDPSQAQARRGRQLEQLDVHFEVVVDGPRASTLRQRQTAAIKDILQWLRDHPEDPGEDP